MGYKARLKKMRNHFKMKKGSESDDSGYTKTGQRKVIAQVSIGEDGKPTVTEKIVEPETVECTGQRKIYKTLKDALKKGVIK